MSDNIVREPYRNAWYKQLETAVKEHDKDVDELKTQVSELSENVEGLENEIESMSDRILPIVTSEDEGKTLVVDANGEWVLGTVTGGLPYVNLQLQSTFSVEV